MSTQDTIKTKDENSSFFPWHSGSREKGHELKMSLRDGMTIASYTRSEGE